jgi:hypothetical protein
MGSGSPRAGTYRPAAGGMSGDGRPTIRCPASGNLPAEPEETARPGTRGAVEATDTRVVLLVGGEIAAVALPSDETSKIRGCIIDGWSYEGVLEESQERWIIRYQEA